jgi:signal peptidase I
VAGDADLRLAAGVALVRDWIAAGRPTWLVLRGDSMRPFLPDGSRVRIAPVAPGQLSIGDLVVYETEGRLVCHRVVRRRARPGGAAFLTKGDGPRTFPAWISGGDVVGRVVEVERRGRVVRLRHPGRRLHALAAAAASLAAVALRRAVWRIRWPAASPAA